MGIRYLYERDCNVLILQMPVSVQIIHFIFLIAKEGGQAFPTAMLMFEPILFTSYDDESDKLLGN